MGKKNSKRQGCLSLDAVGALLGSGTGQHERYGWSNLNCMQVVNTSSVAREHESQKILREVHNQEVIVRYMHRSALVERHVG